MNYVLDNRTFGPNQFAYTPEYGARDAIAYIVLEWITAMAKGCKVGIHCSDVAGALDRVEHGRLVSKLEVMKLDPNPVRVFASWLKCRRSTVLDGGEAGK